ncbi:MAG: alpha/beta fold hydrolase [Pseudomonadota bacterium]
MAEPILFLPGMMCDARLFAPQIDMLSADRGVMVGNLTGSSQIGALAARVLDEAPRRFALVGLSMGGIVAMEILSRAPDRVTRVCLMDTNPLPETPKRAAEREPQIIGARTGRLAEIIRTEIKPAYLAPGPQRVDILNLVVDMAEALGPDVFVDQSRALQRRLDQQATLRSARMPALILCGAEDTLCPVQRHEHMADLMPNARLEVVPDAGHLPVLEQPARVNRLLSAWLDEPMVLR